ncbi:MAG: alanine--tRNA ligase-related protein [Candidatus Paceibacterota bacterium]
MTSNQIREKFLKFFESKGYKEVKSSSLVPEGDSSVLFTTAGMQQFKPFYTGTPSPYGDKVVSIQKCLRTNDIEEVGDDTHLTFFEMLGNFSFNNAVSKKEAILSAYEFITKEINLNIDYVTIFGGDEITPKDEEAEKIWKEIDPNLKIKEEGREDVFWGPTGDEGPCGPTTEIYINGVEIWNIVFNEYYKDKDGNFKKLDNFELILNGS